jgi:tRNA threonylcarbamoyladenosine biosynthesis protein TsaE
MTSSPTFSLVNEYETADGEILYHFDLYRINTEEEGYDMGLDEYFYSGNLCLIEWPEKTPNLIPIDHTSIVIKQLPDGRRHLTVK